MLIKALVPLLFAGCLLNARAAELTLVLKDQLGHPLAGAVVALVLEGEADLPPSAPVALTIRGQQFGASLSAATTASAVRLLNRDVVPYRLCVAAVVKASPAEACAAGTTADVDAARHEDRAAERTLTLSKPGLYRVSNEKMVSYLYVVDGHAVAVTDEDGRARFPGFPGGAGRIQVWHPNATADLAMIPFDNPSSAASAPLSIPVLLRSSPKATPSSDPASSDF